MTRSVGAGHAERRCLGSHSFIPATMAASLPPAEDDMFAGVDFGMLPMDDGMWDDAGGMDTGLLEAKNEIALMEQGGHRAPNGDLMFPAPDKHGKGAAMNDDDDDDDEEDDDEQPVRRSLSAKTTKDSANKKKTKMAPSTKSNGRAFIDDEAMGDHGDEDDDDGGDAGDDVDENGNLRDFVADEEEEDDEDEDEDDDDDGGEEEDEEDADEDDEEEIEKKAVPPTPSKSKRKPVATVKWDPRLGPMSSVFMEATDKTTRIKSCGVPYLMLYPPTKKVDSVPVRKDVTALLKQKTVVRSHELFGSITYARSVDGRIEPCVVMASNDKPRRISPNIALGIMRLLYNKSRDEVVSVAAFWNFVVSSGNRLTLKDEKLRPTYDALKDNVAKKKKKKRIRLPSFETFVREMQSIFLVHPSVLPPSVKKRLAERARGKRARSAPAPAPSPPSSPIKKKAKKTKKRAPSAPAAPRINGAPPAPPAFFPAPPVEAKREFFGAPPAPAVPEAPAPPGFSIPLLVEQFGALLSQQEAQVIQARSLYSHMLRTWLSMEAAARPSDSSH